MIVGAHNYPLLIRKTFAMSEHPGINIAAQSAISVTGRTHMIWGFRCT